jgi:hypothetical protein
MKPDLIQKRRESNVRVFKRWSRKSYAAFASMHKEIKISCINASYSLLSNFENRFVPAFEGRINEFRMKNEDPELPLPEESQWMTPLLELQQQIECPKYELTILKIFHSFLGTSTNCYRFISSSYPIDSGTNRQRNLPKLIPAQIPFSTSRENWATQNFFRYGKAMC